jgi:muramoyltetrapeptide carboxypeptidase
MSKSVIDRQGTRSVVPTIRVIAPSGPVAPIELEMGIERMTRAGIPLEVDPRVYSSHRFFAGSDEDRLNSLLDAFYDPSVSAIWVARGGYGSARLLPSLLAAIKRRGKPKKKTLIGYSDATALQEFVMATLGWDAVHAPMLGLKEFLTKTSEEDLKIFVSGMKKAFLRESKQKASPLKRLEAAKAKSWKPWGGSLEYLGGARPQRPLNGLLVGGNLAVWCSLLGTPFQGRSRGTILFLEDIAEAPYRIDRMLVQLEQAGGLKGVRAVVLGSFTACHDVVSQVLKSRPRLEDLEEALKNPRPEWLRPIRAKMSEVEGVLSVFKDLAARTKIPVYSGFPAGHGGRRYPLQLGKRVYLTPLGKLKVES